jgi:hypothetical protein
MLPLAVMTVIGIIGVLLIVAAILKRTQENQARQK